LAGECTSYDGTRIGGMYPTLFTLRTNTQIQNVQSLVISRDHTPAAPHLQGKKTADAEREFVRRCGTTPEEPLEETPGLTFYRTWTSFRPPLGK
jgi:hypothetical protein